MFQSNDKSVDDIYIGVVGVQIALGVHGRRETIRDCANENYNMELNFISTLIKHDVNQVKQCFKSKKSFSKYFFVGFIDLFIFFI